MVLPDPKFADFIENANSLTSGLLIDLECQCAGLEHQ